MVYFPTDVFTNILSYCEDFIKTNQQKKQIKLNTQLYKLATALTYDGIDWKFFILPTDSFNNNKIIKIFDDRYNDSDDESDEEYDSDFFEEGE